LNRVQGIATSKRWTHHLGLGLFTALPKRQLRIDRSKLTTVSVFFMVITQHNEGYVFDSSQYVTHTIEDVTVNLNHSGKRKRHPLAFITSQSTRYRFE
jgi:hypothetical protein